MSIRINVPEFVVPSVFWVLYCSGPGPKWEARRSGLVGAVLDSDHQAHVAFFTAEHALSYIDENPGLKRSGKVEVFPLEVTQEEFANLASHSHRQRPNLGFWKGGREYVVTSIQNHGLPTL